MIKGDYYKRRSIALKELEHQVTIAVKKELEIDMQKVLHEFTQYYAVGQKPLIEAMEFFEERYGVKVKWHPDADTDISKLTMDQGVKPSVIN